MADPNCDECKGRGYLGNFENCRTCSPATLNRCACGTNIPTSATRCLRCISEARPAGLAVETFSHQTPTGEEQP